jgi:hypothetical protein
MAAPDARARASMVAMIGAATLLAAGLFAARAQAPEAPVAASPK